MALQVVFSVEIVDQLVPLHLRADLVLGEFGNPKLVCLVETVLSNIMFGGWEDTLKTLGIPWMYP